MIEEDYVSFEIAELLKEKGFDEECFMFWHYDKANDKDDTDGISLYNWNENDSNRVTNSELDEYFNDKFSSEGYSAPTLQMAVKWLRVVHKIDLCVFPCHYDYCLHGYECKVYKNKELLLSLTGFKLYETAINAAILYILKNLM